MERLEAAAGRQSLNPVTDQQTEKWRLETERLRLRAVTVDDAALMLAV